MKCVSIPNVLNSTCPLTREQACNATSFIVPHFRSGIPKVKPFAEVKRPATSWIRHQFKRAPSTLNLLNETSNTHDYVICIGFNCILILKHTINLCTPLLLNYFINLFVSYRRSTFEHYGEITRKQYRYPTQPTRLCNILINYSKHQGIDI